jgi:hypothetical protein
MMIAPISISAFLLSLATAFSVTPPPFMWELNVPAPAASLLVALLDGRHVPCAEAEAPAAGCLLRLPHPASLPTRELRLYALSPASFALVATATLTHGATCGALSLPAGWACALRSSALPPPPPSPPLWAFYTKDGRHLLQPR